MNRSRSAREEVIICVIALLIACVLASNQITNNGLAGWAKSYAYWITRILIETALFTATFYTIEKYLLGRVSEWIIFALAVVVSLIPFVLVITSVDLIIGLPELGLNEDSNQSVSRLPAFGKELIYLFDNHLALCASLLLPRLLMHSMMTDNIPNDVVVSATEAIPQPDSRSFLETLDPPLTGKIYWVEAQEHYVRIATTVESRMVLLRFADAVRELPSSEGMQVHRSHWVAFAEFKELLREGQNLKLRLKSEELVPVSRSYRQQVEESFRG